MPSERVYIRSKDAIARDLGEVLVILDLRTQNYYSTNYVGADIWSLLDGKRTVGDIASTIAERYRADHVEVINDVQDVLRDLCDESLVQDCTDHAERAVSL